MLNFFFYLPCGGERHFREECLKFASIDKGDRILDLCCGAGELACEVAKYAFLGKVVGVDISRTAIDTARRNDCHTKASFVAADARNLPFEAYLFDKCFISLGLHHMSRQERKKTLEETYRIIVPKGKLYVVDYNLPERLLGKLTATYFAKLDSSEEAYEMLRYGNLRREIKQAGFKISRRASICQGIIQLIEAYKE